MTLDELTGERNALMDFRLWLLDKLQAVEIDLACNEQEAEEMLADMEREANKHDK